MSKAEKLLAKLLKAEKTFPWRSLVTLLSQLGFEKTEMAGSRVRFYHPESECLILLHKPHPENIIKGGALKAVKQALSEERV